MNRFVTAKKNWIFLLAGLFLTLLSVNNSSAQNLPRHTKDGAVILENFQDDSLNELPTGWYNRDGDHRLKDLDPSKKKRYQYRVVKDRGNKFLRYQGQEAMHINLPLINDDKDNIYNINLHETPILSWKVRAHNLPKNAREDDDDKNDSVASIYVAFDMGRVALFKKVPKTIRYSWSSSLKKGASNSKLFGNQQIIVIKSGKEDTGKWITFRRNLVKDYRSKFGDDPPKTPLAILILSDGDSTGSFVKADYDDIKLLPKKMVD